MNYYALFIIVIGIIAFIVTAVSVIGWFVLTIKELLDKFTKRFFPQYYYYNYEDET